MAYMDSSFNTFLGPSIQNINGNNWLIYFIEFDKKNSSLTNAVIFKVKSGNAGRIHYKIRIRPDLQNGRIRPDNPAESGALLIYTYLKA